MANDIENQVRAALSAFEAALKFWIGAKSTLLPFSVVKASERLEEPAFVGKTQVKRIDPIAEAQQIGTFAGGRPDHWKEGQVGQQILFYDRHSVQFETFEIDATFATGGRFKLFSFAGLLKLRYQSRLETNIIRKCQGTIETLEDLGAGSRQEYKTELEYAYALKASIDKSKDPTRKTQRNIASSNLIQDMKESLSNGIRDLIETQTEIVQAQTVLFGQTGDKPKPWFQG